MIGKTILHYKITELLGKGGMGVVYRAEDTKLRRTVALKFLPPNALANEEDKARFVHEARAAAALHHPNICTVYEINEADDQTFISMAHLPGGSLADRIKEGPRPVKEILNIAIQAARGLKAAHNKGIVHRDIKPSNIMFSESGQVTVMDFGLAKSKHQTHVTKLKTTVGTVAYMSPEQTRGDKVDARSDIWSIGVILYEMATGERPFRGDYDEAVIYSILNEPPRPAQELRPDLDPNLIRIIERATAKDPNERYANIDDMINDLEVVRDELRTGETKTWSSSRSRLAPAQGQSPLKKILSVRVLLPIFALIVVVAVIVKVFTRDNGMVTETVAVTDEQGQTIERVIPKSEYMKNFAVYTFDNKTGDPNHDWIEMALATLMEVDLLQDQILNVRGAGDEYALGQLHRAGFKSWTEAPWSLKRRIAKDSNYDYLVTGTYTIEEGEYVVTRSLHNSRTGRLTTQKTYRGTNLFEIADKITLDLKVDLEVPEDYLEDVKDLPVAEMTTTSVSALESFSRSMRLIVIDQEWDQAAVLLDDALAADSTFAFAWFHQLIVALNINSADKTDQAMQNIMRYLYKLPERLQFIIKSVYYQLKKDPDKLVAVLEMMIELYPEDTMGRSQLALHLAEHKRTRDAIALYEEILEIDPSRVENLRTIGLLYRSEGEFDKALEYYQQYAGHFPNLVRSFTPIAEIYEYKGDFEQASSYYNKALIIEPGNVRALRSLGDIDACLGRDKDALDKYNEALSVSKSPQERSEVYGAFRAYYRTRGEMNTSIDYMEKELAEDSKVSPPIQALISELFGASDYATAGRTDEAWSMLERVSNRLQSPYDQFIPCGYLFYYVEVEEPDSAKVALDEAMPVIDAYKIETFRHVLIWAAGRIAELKEDYQSAIKQFEKRLELAPTEMEAYLDIGRCYRKMGRLDEAEAAISKTLKVHPVHPECHYEMALIYSERGDQEKAIDSLNKALTIWKNADPEYPPAKEARDKLSEWTS
ncbi:MAG: protein kinase [Candidatus Latescibacterota bacterium]|nr:MAG: protein kinase [Candidatus Latescibacterota bacterium]